MASFAARAKPRASTLVETSLALAVAAFALTAVLGAVPMGLHAMREARSQEIAANLAQRWQASLQAISFTDNSSETTVQNLAASPHYYTEDGMETADPAHANGTQPPAFYKAAFQVDDLSFNPSSTMDPDSSFIDPAHARNVLLTLSYPVTGNLAGKRTFTYSFLVARQGALVP